MPVTAQGFERPTVLELFQEVVDEVHATVSDQIDYTPPAPLAVIDGIRANQLGKGYEALEVAYGAFDPDTAENFLLLAICKLSGTEFHGATPTAVLCQCSLAAGTQLLAGTHFAAVSGSPDIRATPKANFTAPTTSSFPILFVCEQTGPIPISLNTLTVIATALTGWTAVNNPSDGILGQVADTDATLRTRRETELAASGSSSVDAIAADVERVDGVQSVLVLENVTSTVDANGLPPKSFEVVLWDGGGGALDDALAQTIWNTKPGGIQPFGGAGSGTALDRNGKAQPVAFTRSTQKTVYIEYTLTVDGTFDADAFKLAVTTAANAAHKTDTDVLFARMNSIAFPLQGVVNVLGIKLGFAPSPTLSADLPITLREIARFDVGRITVIT